MAVGFNQKPNGIAFVELKSLDDLLLAKQKHKQHIGSRYIEGVLQSSDGQMLFQ